MRIINVSEVTKAIKQLFINANYILPEDVLLKLKEFKEKEQNQTAKNILSILEENAEAARIDDVPICQDTGMAVVFAEIGQDVYFEGGLFTDAVNEGVRHAYKEGALRKSVVGDPISRINTGDNTPAVIYTELVKGDKIKLTALPKGFGSENMSRQMMFTPSATEKDIINFVTETVILAGGNPCPPIVIGIGLGGTFDYSCVLAKKALSRKIGIGNGIHTDLAERILEEVNKTGVGVQGLGGSTTALGVNIESYPTHIASLPVAVNISCHVTRHSSIII
ncbi:MAG: fumarate hydratase [Clostridiales bacterium GWF2_36_10]|nr:MAG: fumarate hydratase [Clostridiales bacterium GWF2_36_10]HAN20909.1 fumarate hydratase [Clostridiales bacterium]